MEELNTRNFDNAIQQNYVIAEFYADGCMNCRLLAPILANLEQHNPAIKFVRINADYAPTQVERLNITALPTLIFLKNGQIFASIVGYKSQKFLQTTIDDFRR